MSPKDTKLRPVAEPGSTADIKERVKIRSDLTVPSKRQKTWNQMEKLLEQWQTRGLIPADDQPGPTEAHRKAVVEHENAEYLQQEKAWIKAGQPSWYGPENIAMNRAEKRKAMVASLVFHLEDASQGLTNSLHVVELSRRMEEKTNRRMEELGRIMEKELGRRMEEQLNRRMEAELIRGMEERRKADEAHNDIIEERQREEDKYQQLLAERRQEDVRFQDMKADRQRRERREQEERRTQRKCRTNYSPDYSEGQGDEDDDGGTQSETSRHSPYHEQSQQQRGFASPPENNSMDENEQHYPGTCPKTRRTKTGAHTSMPLIAAGRGGFQYQSWIHRDMEALVAKLPPLTKGGQKWVTDLERYTAQDHLCLGDMRALLGRIEGLLEARAVDSEANCTHDPDDTSFNYIRSNYWAAIRHIYPTTRSLHALTGLRKGTEENMHAFLKRCEGVWEDCTGERHDVSPAVTMLWKDAKDKINVSVFGM
ncbi:trichohyalin-like [Notothenia coriiceps]|uniref:Trichohyalin-like n=1 Tax=Notothenia coriiceps TaxID=8208 RepID=A0A6I9NGQ2_9TELE|nr:PREDICTED: trichohyalin-like [Notothenia coriiceps]